MKLSEFIPLQDEQLKKEHGNQVATAVERRLRELLSEKGDLELDDNLAAILLGQRKIFYYSEASQKVYWTIYDACMEVNNKQFMRRRK